MAPAARQDLREILRWTEVHFGKAARERYQALIKQAARDISVDPLRPGSTERPEILDPGCRTYHLAVSRDRVSGTGRVRTPRHFLLYRIRDDGLIEIARVLHDALDFTRHVPPGLRA